ncbi:hypothetical protein KAR91_80540 [Candidatus Pacearchaeota archaeon]|nr:hypothetical protein [Candidatus Pacearchaeota archaeon]
MKFIIDESLESLIQRIAGPVEIICKDNTDYEVIGIPKDKKDVVRKAIKEYIEARGKAFHEID